MDMHRMTRPTLMLMKNNHAFVLLALAFTLAAGAAEPATNSASSSATRAVSAQIPALRVRAAVEQALQEKQVDQRLQRLADLGAGLSLSEIPDALEAAGGLKELRERMVLKQALLIRWGELAPEVAFTQIARLPESQLKANTLRETAARFTQKAPERAAAAAAVMSAGRARNDAIILIANVWAQTNVNAALQWAGKFPDSFAKESALDAIRYVWVHADPVAASGHVEKLPPGRTKNNLVSNVAFEWAARDPQAAIRWANGLPDGPDKESALASTAESWANQDPQSAAAFALKLPPGEARAQAGALVALRWAKQDPRKAADWSWQSGDAEVRRRGLKEVLELWAAVDPAECVKWIENLPTGPDRDHGIRAFVTAVVAWAPDSAACAAMLIEDEAGRFQALDECLPAWLEVDPTSATNWLSQAKLPEALKARWRDPKTLLNLNR